MKNLFLFAMVFLLMFFGCGKDGEDGKAFLSFDWDSYVDSYSDNNPNVPRIIYRGQEYRVFPGTYFFHYDCSDGYGNYWGFDGYYTIQPVDKGEPGGIFFDGDDGKDTYYNMYLSGSGAWWQKTASPDKQIKEFLERQNLLENYNKVLQGEPIKSISYTENGRGMLIVEKQMYVYVPKP